MAEETHTLERAISSIPRLPSADAAAELLDGKEGAWGKMVMATFERSALIGLGLWLAGIRGRKLWAGALTAAVLVSMGVVGHVWWQRKRASAYLPAGGGSAGTSDLEAELAQIEAEEGA